MDKDNGIVTMDLAANLQEQLKLASEIIQAQRDNTRPDQDSVFLLAYLVLARQEFLDDLKAAGPREKSS